MISTRYYDSRSKDVAEELRTARQARDRGTSLPAITQAVLDRWMQSVWACPSDRRVHC
jgi:hypothetical protein